MSLIDSMVFCTLNSRMGLNTNLLRSSFSLVVEREPELTRNFYQLLFTRYPELKRLFGRNEPAAQQRMLTEALVSVLEHLEDAIWLQSKLKVLGAKHQDYGVTEPMYDQVDECLLDTIGEIAGPLWTLELAQAWSDAFSTIRELMLAGVASDNARSADAL